MFGIDQSFHIDGPFMDWLDQYSHLDAKRAFADINGSEILLALPDMPMAVDGAAPEEPSVFTNGSFSAPKHPYFHLLLQAYGGRNDSLAMHRLRSSSKITPRTSKLLMGSSLSHLLMGPNLLPLLVQSCLA